MRRRKKAKEVKEAARVRASEDAQSEADMQALCMCFSSAFAPTFSVSHDLC